MMISMHEMSCLFACEMLNNVSHQVNYYKQIKQIKELNSHFLYSRFFIPGTKFCGNKLKILIAYFKFCRHGKFSLLLWWNMADPIWLKSPKWVNFWSFKYRLSDAEKSCQKIGFILLK